MNSMPIKVSQVTQYIKKLLISDPILHNIEVEGEISNFKHHYSGHMYFTLKDDKSTLKCIMFNNNCNKLDFIPNDGMHVVVSGYISIYEKSGTYQLYCKDIKKRGIGELYENFEKLKNKLQSEGLFDKDKKKPLPYIPRKIGVVTSSTGAAVRDIISVIKRRLPCVDIILYPVLVQGDKAHYEICEALNYLNSRDDIDVVIIGRGGGSIEELWAFNEEDVARAIYNMKIPVISAVGHETDFTIADFVSDLRAPTPSAAGELVVPVIDELNDRIDTELWKLNVSYSNYINKKRNKLDNIKNIISYNNPISRINEDKKKIDRLIKDLVRNIHTKENNLYKDLENLVGKLNSLSPLSVISRGYSIVLNESGHVINSITKVKNKDKITLMFKDGEVKATVQEIILRREKINDR